MSDALRLVSEVNSYLDSVDEQGSFDEARMPKLEDFKTQMLERGFNAPFQAMMAQTRAEMEDEEADDLADKSKQIKRFRYIAALKRFTLNRTRVALASHKLAQALRESGQAALIPHLPFGGSYVKALSQSGDMGMEGYHFLMGLFTPRRFNLSSASALIKTAGAKNEEKELDLGAEEDPASALKGLLSKGRGSKTITIQNRPITLIKNHSTRVALFTMASCATEAKARQTMKEEEKGDRRLGDYNALLHRYGLVADVEIVQVAEVLPKLLEEAAKGGFVVKTKAGDFLMEEKLEAQLHARRAQHRHLCIEGTRAIVYRLILWYYVCFHSEGRKSYGAMPSVLAEPDEQQLRVLKELQPQEGSLKHVDRIVVSKLQAEGRAPPLPSKVWGPAFVALKANKKAKWAAETFFAEEQAIADAMLLVKGLLEAPEGRGSKFLGALKKKK